MPIDYVGLSCRIREFRQERGFTQEELSARAGLSSHYIGNIEQCVRKPSLRSILRICKALGVTFDQLFKDSITDEMAAGICIYLNDENTLRQAPTAFFDALSDYFYWESDDEFADLIWPAFTPEPEPDSDAQPIPLSDYLLLMDFEEEP